MSAPDQQTTTDALMKPSAVPDQHATEVAVMKTVERLFTEEELKETRRLATALRCHRWTRDYQDGCVELARLFQRALAAAIEEKDKEPDHEDLLTQIECRRIERDNAIANASGWKWKAEAAESKRTELERENRELREDHLNEALNAVCKNLPDGWCVRIDAEQGAAQVTLVNAESIEWDMYEDETSIAKQLLNSIDAARNGGAT